MRVSRTTSTNTEFQMLVNDLNQYLKIVDGEDHAFYHQFNGIEQLNHVVVVYDGSRPVGCGAVKPFREDGMEIKRMYTLPAERGKGIAGIILTELENWSRELGKSFCILETGKRQVEAVGLYRKSGYEVIPNYPPYENMENSICFQKILK